MAAIDTQLMKEVIKTSFNIDAFLKEARMSDTYAAAKLQYPVPIDEIPIPEEREAEEDTGPVADEVGEAIVTTADDSTGVFDVEVGQEEEETEMHVGEDGLEDVEEIIEDVSADVQPAPQLQAKKRRTQTGKPVAKAGKRKRTEDAVAAALPVVSRTGRVVQPSTVHGTIVANRYSTLNNNSCSITDTLRRYNASN